MNSTGVSSPFVLFWDRLKSIAPEVFEILLILVVGLFLAWFIKILLRWILSRAKFDNLCHRSGISSALVRANIRRSPSEIVAIMAYWFIVLVLFLSILSVLRVQILDELTASFLLYLPRFFIALIVLIFGYFLSRFVARAVLIALVNAQVKSAQLISLVVQSLLIILFLTIGIEQLGIAKGVVLVAFTILLGGVVLSLAIAFGLGGKDMAKDFLEKKAKSAGESKKKPDEFSHI